MTRTAMLVVAKAPEPGRAKTRLSPTVTPEVAAEIAASSLLDTLQAVHEATKTDTFVAWSGNLNNAVHGNEIRAALTRATVIPQHGDGLAARLAAAHGAVADRVASPVFQIGMDTPQVDAELLADCAAPLERSGGPDAVLGLAEDDGWWALGLRNPRHAEILHSVPMSRADTGKLTLDALRSAGLVVDELPQLRDVDTMEDAYRVAASVPLSRFATTVTARVAGTT